MFDTMTMTKIAAGFLGAWLILLLGKWAGEEIYYADAHGEQSYVIEVAEAASGPVEEIDMAVVMAEADAANGEKVFRKCAACHKVNGEDATGPHLNGVVGREIAAVQGFPYSNSLIDIEGDWTPEELNAFLTSPKGYAPGTTMGFAGLKKVDERADVIAYLQTVGN